MTPSIDWRELGLVRAEPACELPEAPRTVADVLAQAVAQWPDREALVGRHARYTYRELAAEVAAAAAALQALGVQTGDRVAATTANHTDIVIAFFAAQALGAVWVGVNRSLAGPEKRFILEDCGAKIYLADRAGADQITPVSDSLPDLREVIDMEPGDPQSGWARLIADHRGRDAAVSPADPYAPAAIAYTSGTTGFPKGVVHSQHNIVLVGLMGRLSGGRADIQRPGVALPLTILNLMILSPVAAFQNGRTLILMDRVDSVGLAEWIKREQVESFAAAPTMIYDLMTKPEIDPEDLVSFKSPGVGGAAMPESFRAFYRERFGRELGTSYGLTEAPTAVTVSSPATADDVIPGASGKVQPHLRVSIQNADGRLLTAGDSGEICVGAAIAGPYAGLYTPMLGYWRRPEATAEALKGGWLHTGDMGRLDSEGNLFVEGRRNDVVIRGGSNVYPAEIERVLHMDDRVAACAVVGRPDPRLGEQVVAFVQPVAGADAASLQLALEALCRENLARYKAPEDWVFVADMPRNAMNKIVKATLKATLFADAPQAAPSPSPTS